MALITQGTYGSSPGMQYVLNAEQTAGSGNKRTIKLTLKLKAGGSTATSWYEYPCNHRFHINGHWSDYYTTKGSESWNGTNNFRSFEYTYTTDVGTTSTKAITVGFQTNHPSYSYWNCTKTGSYTVGATNVAPAFSSSAYLKFRENSSSGAVITSTQVGPENYKKIPENVSKIYIDWGHNPATDSNNDKLTYEIWHQSNYSTWSKVGTTTGTNFTHTIGVGNQGSNYDYFVKARNPSGAYSKNCDGVQFEKNALTGYSLSSSSSINKSTTSVSFSYTGAKNTNGDNTFSTTLTCDKVSVYNNTASPGTVTIYNGPGNPPSGCYIQHSDIADAFASSNYQGNLAFTLTTTNAYGTSKTSTKIIPVNFESKPTTPSSISVSTNSNESTMYTTILDKRYYIPNGANRARIKWGSAIGGFGEGIRYEVYASYNEGSSWSIIADNLTNTFYDHYPNRLDASKSVRYKVRARSVKFEHLFSEKAMTSSITMHYYRTPTITVSTINRSSDHITVSVKVNTNSSIEISASGTMEIRRRTDSVKVGPTKNVTDTLTSYTMSELTESAAYSLIISYNDASGLSFNQEYRAKVIAYTHPLLINAYGIGVNGATPDSEYPFMCTGAGRFAGAVYAYDAYPSGPGDSYLGSSRNRWERLFTHNSPDISSDVRHKENIASCDDKIYTLYSQLNPCSWTRIDGDSGRRHYGFIAQEVEAAMKAAGMEYHDFAFLQKCPLDVQGEIIDPTTIKDYDNDARIADYEYSLCYDEMISVNTHMIQKLQNENKELIKQIDELKRLVTSIVNKED